MLKLANTLPLGRRLSMTALLAAGVGLAGFNVACDDDDAELEIETSGRIVPVLMQSGKMATATAEGDITIEKSAPQEIKLGTTTEYTINYANTSGGGVNGLIIREELPEGFAFESSTPEPTSQDGNVLTFRMNEMRDGDTGSITIKGTPQQLGDLQACTYYEFDRGICSVLSVVNPELRLTKSLASEGPFSVCTPVEMVYVLKNEGDTAASDVLLFDELPEGMMFAESGERTMEMEVGDLAAGKSMEQRVMVKAERPASFGSYAIAKSELGEVKSERIEAEFAAPKLEISAQPARPFTYVGEDARFQLTIRNTGSVAADRAVLAAAAGQGAEVTNIYVSDDQRGDDDKIMLGTLQPGQSTTVYVDVSTPDEAAVVKLGAVTQAVCRDSGAELARAEAVAQLEVRTISALQLEVVDQQDPVQVGGQTVYEVTVINEGSGPDNNLKVSAVLPKGTKFVSAQGDTEVTNDGNKVTMTEVPTLESGGSVTWYVTVEAVEAAGGQKFDVTINSDNTDGDITEAEPTRLY